MKFLFACLFWFSDFVCFPLVSPTKQKERILYLRLFGSCFVFFFKHNHSGINVHRGVKATYFYSYK